MRVYPGGFHNFFIFRLQCPIIWVLLYGMKNSDTLRVLNLETMIRAGLTVRRPRILSAFIALITFHERGVL